MPGQHFRLHVWRLAVFLLPLLCVPPAASGEETKEHRIESELKSFSNGFYAVTVADGAVTSLRLDATGKGAYGHEWIASGQTITGLSGLRAEGPRLAMAYGHNPFSWPIPFIREGYYDADQHLHYPDPTTTANTQPMVLPVRKFVTSTGQTVFIEYFKRQQTGDDAFLWLNLKNGNRLWVFGDEGFGGHAALHLPHIEALFVEVRDDFLRVHSRSAGETVELEIMAEPEGMEARFTTLVPETEFIPEFLVKNDLTGKTVQASPLATDLLDMAIYWHPSMMTSGEWMLDSVRTHWFTDARSVYGGMLREGLLTNFALIGYDRYEHFGMLFNWGQYPDYGAGGLLNTPPGNAPYDMRMLHVNAMHVIALAEYVMTTGDRLLLDAKSARWIATDGDESQPICGSSAEAMDFVLAAGDSRLDGSMPDKTYSLGQRFTATQPFQTVYLRLGAPVTNQADVYEEKRTVDAEVCLYRVQDRALLARQTIELTVGEHDQRVQVALPKQAPPGQYDVRLSDPRSGKRYFGPCIAWWTDPEAPYGGGAAFFGPLSGDMYDRAKCLFEYLYNYTGARNENLSYYVDDREINIPDQRSGRPGVSMQNSYHECLGGGYDAMMGLWYPSACRAMAQLAKMRDDAHAGQHYADLAEKADNAYNGKYWREVAENGKTFRRYVGSIDWDGNVHDYGFTYYNLEAADLGIPSPAQVRDILWWLDRGYWKDSQDSPWREDIYAPWQIAPPFNTIEIGGWTGITGKLPYFEVLTNGGARLIYEARDLTVRARHAGVDNMHERNKQVLARFASPDRLTGGRTFPDPGKRGRWHFGPPFVDRADIEGFREIFPGNGSLATAQIAAYLGASFEPSGLRLTPRVPSDLDGLAINHIGFRGGVFDFALEALRDPVDVRQAQHADERQWVFIPAAPFTQAGVQVHVAPDSAPYRGGAHVTLTLERKDGAGQWSLATRNWLSHVRDGQWVWARTDKPLDNGVSYRLRVEPSSRLRAHRVARATGNRSGTRTSPSVSA